MDFYTQTHTHTRTLSVSLSGRSNTNSLTENRNLNHKFSLSQSQTERSLLAWGGESETRLYFLHYIPGFRYSAVARVDIESVRPLHCPTPLGRMRALAIKLWKCSSAVRPANLLASCFLKQSGDGWRTCDSTWHITNTPALLFQGDLEPIHWAALS